MNANCLRITCLFILVTLSCSDIAYAERSFLLMPGVARAEQLAESANILGRSHMKTAPGTANGAMIKLHHIDADLDRIIPLARRFQQTSLMIEQGIHEARNLAQESRRLVEWKYALAGGYQLMHAVQAHDPRDDMRTIVTILMLENLLAAMDMHIRSTGQAVNIALQLSHEAKIIRNARERLYQQLALVRQELKGIRNKAKAQM